MRLRELNDSYRTSGLSLALVLALVTVVGLTAVMVRFSIARSDEISDRQAVAAVTALLDARRAGIAAALSDAVRGPGPASAWPALKRLPTDASVLHLSEEGRAMSPPLDPSSAEAAPNALGGLLAEKIRRARGGSQEPATGFVSIDGAAWLVGLAQVASGPAAGTWLAVVETLDPPLLASLADAAGLGEVSLSAAGASPGLNIPLPSLDGRSNAALSVAPKTDSNSNARHWAIGAGLALTLGLALALVVVHRRLVVIGRRIAEHESAAYQRASHDVLTGVSNRMAFMEGLAQRLDRGLDSAAFTIALIDLDHFKAVNDTFGHPAGDALLTEVGRRLSAVAPAGALVARLGGDEFGILASGVKSAAQARELGRAICETVAAPIRVSGVELHVGASVGLAQAPEDGIERSYLMRCADVALYVSKAEGRGRAELFDAAMDTDRRHRKSIARQLHAAILLDEFMLDYQPIFATEGGEVRGVEALLRWRHSFRGPVSPAEFIPIAEESDLIVRIGAWVLERAMTDANAWPDLYLAVNVSPAELVRGDYPALLTRLLTKTGFPGHRLVIEITEGKLLSRADAILRALEGIRALGARIAIDDFGTGWSSLGYLTRFQFDRLKIDRSFVTDVALKPEQAAIVRAVSGLARGLDLNVVAEGVETDDDLAFIRAAGVGEAQGFGLARPMSAAAFSRSLGLSPTLQTENRLRQKVA